MPQPIQRKRFIMEFSQLYDQHWNDIRFRNRKRNSVVAATPAGKMVGYNAQGQPFNVLGVNGYAGSYQETADYNNGALLKNLGKGDVGGPFHSYRVDFDLPTFGQGSSITGYQNSNYVTIHGPVYPSSDHYAWAQNASNGTIVTTANLPTYTRSQLLAYGATGISKCLPNVPDSPLMTTIAETASGGLPSIVGRQVLKERSLSSVGSEYLNYQFGVLPLVSDVESLIKSTQQYDKIIGQMKRDSGRLIRRQVELVNESKTISDTTTENTYCYPSWVNGRTRQKLTSTSRVWFSGAFRHSYPKDLDSLHGKLRDFDRVYGISFNADTAWNLIPFSWLADWQGNIGDVMKNVSYLGKDGLELVYGYVMAETHYTRLTEFTGYHNTGYFANLPLKTSATLHFSVKHRLKATPFGFGVDMKALTGSQSAILTALGLSRLK